MTDKDIVKRLLSRKLCKDGVSRQTEKVKREAANLIEALRTQRDEAVAALRKYGEHAADCFLFGSSFDCTCGFTAALAKLEMK